jgi:NitT/TauT family transport system permease protein
MRDVVKLPATTTSSDSLGRDLATASPAQERRPARNMWPVQRLLWQILLASTLVAAWQFLPKIDALSSRYKFLNEFFISSPTRVGSSLLDLVTDGGRSGITIWPYLRSTVEATVLGVAIGLVLGALAGLVFSNFRRLSEVVRPFIVLGNSIPRIALIPIFVVILGPNIKASVLSVVTVVFFLGFFNAFEGGTKIKPAVIDNARLLGAGPIGIMWTIRWPQVLTWTFASVPNAISFGLIVAVASELIAGIRGVGTLLQQAMINLDSALTFALVIALSLVGLVMYGIGVLIKDAVLRWDPDASQ